MPHHLSSCPWGQIPVAPRAHFWVHFNTQQYAQISQTLIWAEKIQERKSKICTSPFIQTPKAGLIYSDKHLGRICFCIKQSQEVRLFLKESSTWSIAPGGPAQRVISALRVAPRRRKSPLSYKRRQGWLVDKATGHHLHEVRDPAVYDLGPEKRGRCLDYQLECSPGNMASLPEQTPARPLWALSSTRPQPWPLRPWTNTDEVCNSSRLPSKDDA